MALWRKGGSKVADWETIVREYKERSTRKTLADMPIETVAGAALYMYGGLNMTVNDVVASFGTHGAWFNDLVLWSHLTPEARKCFSLASYERDRLPLADARLVGSRTPEKQAAAAESLLRARQKKKRPRIIGPSKA